MLIDRNVLKIAKVSSSLASPAASEQVMALSVNSKDYFLLCSLLPAA